MKEDFNDTEKEFKCKGVSITRYDYESLPDPMYACGCDDKTMQKIADDIYDLLLSNGWEDREISKYLGSYLDDVLDNDDTGDMIKDDFWRFMEQAAIENGMKYYEDMDEEPVYESGTSAQHEFVNSEKLRNEIKEILDDETDSWDNQYMKDCADEYIDEYVGFIVDDAIKSFDKLVHRDNTSMSGNFADIKYDWEGFHNELPHGATLKEVVEMIDAGEDNEVTKEFKDWAVEWYFNAFGTYNLKYKWTEFMEEATYDEEDYKED